MENGFAADATVSFGASEKTNVAELGSAPGSTKHAIQTSTASFVQPATEVLKEVNRCVAREIEIREARVEARAQEAKNLLKECDRERESLRAKKALIQEAEKLQLEILGGPAAPPASASLIVPEQGSVLDNDRPFGESDFPNNAEPAVKRTFPAALFASRVGTRN